METLQKLKESGLPENQAKVYLELVKRGSISANELSKKIGLDRTLVYQILNNLIEKGLASYIIKENKKYFEATDPSNLLNFVREKETLINSLIPELKSFEKLQETSQEVKIYEGKCGLRVFFEDVLKAKDVCILGATGNSYNTLKFEALHLAKKAEKSGIHGRLITSYENKNHEMTKIKNLKAKFLENINSPATTTIYNDKIGIHILSDKPIIIIIKNKDISKSYKSYFDILWSIAKS